jgi:DNA-binding beta-propeller fold protein YncE
VVQPTGVATAADGSVYVADAGSNTISHYDPGGRLIEGWGVGGDGPGQLDGVAGLAVGSDGSIFVADHNNYRIQKFSARGKFLLQWGTKGSGSGEFLGPDGIAVAADGQVYVTEDHNARVQVFSSDGRFLRSWNGGPQARFEDPTGITVVGDTVYVADYSASKISAFDRGGNLLRAFGGSGDGPGQFAGISMITSDASGEIFATDYNNGRIQKLDAQGRFLAAYISPSGTRLQRPFGVALTDSGDLVVSEYLGRRIVRLQTS